MFQLRRSALRVLASSPSSFLPRSRGLSSLSTFSIRSRPVSRACTFQRRWATGEAEAKQEEDDAPISELQPTPQEEVENAIHEDNAAVVDAGVDVEAPSESAAAPAAEAFTPADVVEPAAARSTSYAPRGGNRDPSRNSNNEPKSTIYVGNLFFDITDNDLQQEFSRFGKVDAVRLMRDTRGLSKGFGYVDFATVESATAAIEAMHQQLYEGRRIVAQYAAYSTKNMNTDRGSRGGDRAQNPPSKTLFIGNLSFEMTDRDLNNLFRGIRNVIDVRVAIDRRTGQPRGFAHADFIDVKSAMEGMKMLTDKEAYGRKLRIDYSYGPSSAPKNQAPPS